MPPDSAAEPRDGVVVDDDDAEGRVAQHDGPGRERDVHDVEGRPQRHAGDDAGQRDGQDDQQRDLLAPEEPRPRHGGGGQRAEDQRQRGRDRRDLQRQPQRRPDVRRGPRRRANHFSGQARRRELDSSSPRS